MSKELFDKVSAKCSRITTRAYSTSFSLGIKCLEKELREPIYAIYGFVRFADEIVDTFHDYNKELLLSRFKTETYQAIEEKISLNPILNSFQKTVNFYGIEPALYNQFLKSMEMDLMNTSYDEKGISEYILGSAEVVGLMSLRVFCKNDKEMYERLKPSAMKLGSAFQKINFLRDLNADYNQMGRTYFPGVDLSHFDESTKKQLEQDIAADFKAGYEGIKQLPKSARFGVYVAYVYYLALFEKIKNTPSSTVLTKRIRVRNRRKLSILAYSYVRHQLNLI
ncbi:MAG: phytoene/squalene synthase family protein [Cytophagales bacterium]|jgi:phytoene synthase|nr:phytoene/squalene synthase family protein [Cytophagales bacterium]MCA6388188.1 phytoene/squalene synthase family protein [Cytophagales bacterium]MCA6391715.1 phytoene/squalene synthase family protein [Cytophagales bacterium]MCA6394543.1 phytoene/squalene synthase family protein [Cytophagales bacterium]MCA6399511.1 phytoene/squalene synthase family protein [Cytophagales bacterium]